MGLGCWQSVVGGQEVAGADENPIEFEVAGLRSQQLGEHFALRHDLAALPQAGERGDLDGGQGNLHGRRQLGPVLGQRQRDFGEAARGQLRLDEGSLLSEIILVAGQPFLVWRKCLGIVAHSGPK